ncbi:exosortase-associated EpsI family protein [Rosistilla ulvae]|nr:exosortase-associated EpsI family protein [Rosistilla ulvae]
MSNPINQTTDRAPIAASDDSPSGQKAQSQPMRSRTVALVACLSLILLSGFFHGVLDGRWQPQTDLQKIGDQLQDLPTTCGQWDRISESQLDPQAQQILQCYGSLVHEYRNRSTDQRVTVAVMFGPRGPIAVHTPEVCYSSQGTEPAGERVAEIVDNDRPNDRLWRVQFRQTTEEQPHLEVWYGWSDGTQWYAAEYPRVWMTDRLYKIQVAGPPPEMGQEPGVQDFLRSFLPELDAHALASSESQ